LDICKPNLMAALQTLAKIAGVSGLVIGVFYLLYKQILTLRIFSKLSKAQTFKLIWSIAFLVWALAIVVVLDIRIQNIALIFGSYNQQNQNVTIGK